jgi:hypothetical protein
MPRFLRDRLSYANVVATLALFIALGGTSYAAATITSSDIKNRAIKGGDIRRDTITGSEINESKLKEVPLARTAASAQTAVSAAVSDQSKNADSAIRATSAGSADNASQLGGQGAGSFEKSTRTGFGKASVNPAGESGEAVLLSWPELGVQVTSATNQAGNCGGDLSINFRNTKSAGGAPLDVYQQGGVSATVAPAAKSRVCTNFGAGNGIDTEVTDSSGRTLFVDCVVANSEVRCIGTRSEP